MKTYNLIYDKEKNLEVILDNLSNANITVNEIFSSLAIINISSEVSDFSKIEGILDFEEDLEIVAEPSLTEFYWHQLRLVSGQLPMLNNFLPESRGENVSIYLVDSGINANLDEFSEANIINLYSYNNEYSDDFGHGTAMASVIVGKTLGVSTDCILKNVKIPMKSLIHISDLLEAFNIILDDKTDSDEIAIINCSWTISKSKILDSKIRELLDANFLVVAAAGNTLSAADNFSPVGLNSVLGVGASDAFDRVISWGTNAGSNWGPEVDIFAPGIEVTCLTTDGQYVETSGTSVAAAITSAAAAQYINQYKDDNINAYQLQFIIINSSIPDILFRNEHIYETTPNKLLHVQAFNRYIKNIPVGYIDVKKGETSTITLELEEKYASSINIDNVKIGGIVRGYPTWMGLDINSNTITISPPIDVNSHRTYLYIEVLDETENRLSWNKLSINIYEESPDENDENKVELYFEDDTGMMVVTPASCTAYCVFTCAQTPSIKGAFCACDFGYNQCYSYI
jgi:hypothetical protein